MDIDLKQGLGAIAGDAPTVHLDADSVWRQGIRRRNRRRAGAATALVACVALVAGAVGFAATPGLLRTEQQPPAGAVEDARLPDRVWQASGWTPGTQTAGAPGRIAVMWWDNGRRQSLNPLDRDPGGGFMAVSALDGSYRYLDLPGLEWDGSNAPLLSPDGRYVAYALRSAGADDPAAVITGWAVYDAQTGRVVRHAPEGAPKGLGQGGVVWAPDFRTLLLDVCVVTEVSANSQSCTVERVDAWDVVGDRVRTLRGLLVSDVVGRAGDDLVLREGRSLEVFDVRSDRRESAGVPGLVPVARPIAVAVTDDERSAVVASVTQGRGADASITVEVAEQALREGAAVATPVPVLTEVEAVDHLSVTAQGAVTALVHWPAAPPAFVRVDGSAPARNVVALGSFGGAVPQVATDLVGVPTAAGVRPPEVRDPRLVSGGVALGLVVAVGAGLLWRRRRGAAA